MCNSDILRTHPVKVNPVLQELQPSPLRFVSAGLDPYVACVAVDG